MDPNAAQIMAETYREGAGHTRTAYRVRLLLSLDMVGCSKQWATAVELASAYQSAYTASEGKPDDVMRSLRSPLEKAMQAAIRKDGVKIIKRKVKPRAAAGVKPSELKKLSSEWSSGTADWKSRESQFKTRVEYPHLLSTEQKGDIELVRKQNAAVLVTSKGGPKKILEELRSSFKESQPAWEAREAVFKERVGSPGCQKTKNPKRSKKKR